MRSFRSGAQLGMWIRAEIVGWFVQRLEPLIMGTAWVWRRLMLRTRFIVITGSLGKTTAKEVLGRMLATDGRVLRSWANQSGGLLVVLNVLRVRPWHRYAVLEASGAPPGALDELAGLIRPDVVLQLGVGQTHSLRFASLEERAREKGKLCEALGRNGIAVLNAEDPLIRDMRHLVQGRTLFFGLSPECDVRAEDVTSRWPERLSFTCHAGGEALKVKTQLVGKHWLASVLGGLAVARALQLDLQQVVPTVAHVSPFPSRLQPMRLPGGAVVLRDEYNASVPSLVASLEVLREASCEGKKVLVIKDFSDFSGHRRQRLRYLASAAADAIDGVVLIGESSTYGIRRFVEAGLDPENCLRFATFCEAAAGLRDYFGKGDLVLVKGRTTDHMARLFHAWVGPIDCWKESCSKRMLCDECWELGARPQDSLVLKPVEGATSCNSSPGESHP